MKQYLKALNNCLENGIDVESRAGKVRKAFGYQMRFNFNKGFRSTNNGSQLSL